MAIRHQHLTRRAKQSARPSNEELFNRLPPLVSDEYVEFVRTAPRARLPPEVLARAYRQLPPQAPGALATLKRLFGKLDDKRWEYLQPLIKEARRQMKRQQRRNGGVQYKDLLQNALLRILEVLPTAQGAFAETAWNTFCRNEFVNIWRQVYGRRGERLDPPKAEAPKITRDEGDQEQDPFDLLSDDRSFWQSLSQKDHSAEIEAIAAEVADSIEDPFFQAVAQATWFSNQRPKTSGTTTQDQGRTLMELFPDKSRDQINRALRRVDSLLAVALLDHGEITWPADVRRLLEKQKLRGRRS